MTKTFKEYYSDPEFRARHKAYLSEHVECECGCSIVRSNLSKHKKTPKHTKNLEKQQNITLSNEQYQALIKQIKKDLTIK